MWKCRDIGARQQILNALNATRIKLCMLIAYGLYKTLWGERFQLKVMSGIKVRPVVFGEWRRWSGPSIPTSPAEGGVYLLAHSQSGTAPARATLECLPLEVIYVGNTRNLNKRPSDDHAGVQLYDENFDLKNGRLFVTVAPLYLTACKDYAVQRIYSEHLETLLVWKFTEQHGYPPLLHYGHKGQNPDKVDACMRALRG